MSKKKTVSTSEGSALKDDSQVAAGGELHQVAAGDHPALTTNQGVALADNQNSLRAHPRGPTLLEDSSFAKKSRISITSVFRSDRSRARDGRAGFSS